MLVPNSTAWRNYLNVNHCSPCLLSHRPQNRPKSGNLQRPYQNVISDFTDV